MHVDTCHPLKPQRPRLGRPCNHQVTPHFFFDFSQDNQNIQETLFLSFSMGPHTNQNFSLTLLSFLLRKELEDLLSLLLNPRFNTSKGKESSIQFLLHTLSKKLGNSKTLLSSLPLIFSGPTTRKGRSFHARVILCLFPLKNHKLGKGFNYSHLRIHDFLNEFLVMVFMVYKIRKS